MTTQNLAYADLARRYRLTTDELASQHRVQPQTIRKHYAVNGTYHGITPLRLPNRRLLWPDDTIDQLLAANRKSEAA